MRESLEEFMERARNDPSLLPLSSQSQAYAAVREYMVENWEEFRDLLSRIVHLHEICVEDEAAYQFTLAQFLLSLEPWEFHLILQFAGIGFADALKRYYDLWILENPKKGGKDE